MAGSGSELAARIERLERDVAEMKRRLEVLERFIASRSDHPTDRSVVREKAVFDWQA